MNDSITLADLLNLRDEIFPPLYYATHESLERGKVVWSQENSRLPEFFVCHPDDLDELAKGITGRRLVHLRDLPPEDMSRLLRLIIES